MCFNSVSAQREANEQHKSVKGGRVSLLPLGTEKQPQTASYMCENVLSIHRLSFYNKSGFFYCQGKKMKQMLKLSREKMRKEREKCYLEIIKSEKKLFMEGQASLSPCGGRSLAQE